MDLYGWESYDWDKKPNDNMVLFLQRELRISWRRARRLLKRYRREW